MFYFKEKTNFFARDCCQLCWQRMQRKTRPQVEVSAFFPLKRFPPWGLLSSHVFRWQKTHKEQHRNTGFDLEPRPDFTKRWCLDPDTLRVFGILRFFRFQAWGACSLFCELMKLVKDKVYDNCNWKIRRKTWLL